MQTPQTVTEATDSLPDPKVAQSCSTRNVVLVLELKSWTDTSRPTKFSPFTQPHYLVFRKTKRHVKDQWWIRKKQDWCNLMRLVSLFLSKILKLPSLSSSHQFTHHNPPTVPFQAICGTVTSPLWSTLFPQMQMFSLLPTSENRTKSLYKRPMEKKCKKQRN